MGAAASACYMGDGLRRKTNVDDVPDDVLGLVFVCLTSPLDLVRAAFTCKRWRHVIAADGFRVLCSLHGAPSSHVVGHYRVDEHLRTRLPPGSNPVFVPSFSSSPWADIVAARNLALDFLPPPEVDYSWELTDVRGSLLLLIEVPNDISYDNMFYIDKRDTRLIIYDPLARRYREIPPSARFHGCHFIGAFLLDGEDAGARISLSNFRVTCALSHPFGPARASAFSPAGGGRWTHTAPFHRWTSCSMTFTGTWIHFAGCGGDGSVAYWTLRHDPLRHVLTLDKEAAEVWWSVLDNPEYDALRNKHLVPEYAYELPWPPTIRACSS